MSVGNQAVGRHRASGRAEFPCRARAGRRGCRHGQRQDRASGNHERSGGEHPVAGTPARIEPRGPSMTDIDAGAALPRQPRDIIPFLLPVMLSLVAMPLIGSSSSWITLTVASLGMGMMIFIMASGLTLVFGLMDVLNFRHGAFISIGAYVATLVL